MCDTGLPSIPCSAIPEERKEVAMKITPKQERFIKEYLVDLNATAAAIRAGYSEKTAHMIGFENLKKPEIIEKLRATQEALSKEIKVEIKRVILELCCLSFYNVQDMFDEENNLRSVRDMPEQTARAITGVEETVQERVVRTSEEETVVRRTRKLKYKLGKKDSALDKLARHLGVYLENNKQQPERIKMIFNLGGAKEK